MRGLELTAPIYIFILMPLSLLLCRLAPTNRRRLLLSLFSILMLVLAHRNNPLGLVHIELLLIFSLSCAYFPTPRSPLGGKIRTIVAIVVPSLSLVVARILADYNIGNYVYPAGLGFITFASISFAVDMARGDSICPENPLELIGYLVFFPTLIAGPLIRSKHYFDNTDAITPSLQMMSHGIRLYMRGFIKRVALAAVLLRSFQDLLQFSADAISPFLLLLLLLFSFLAFYFFITGSADMGRGVCAMLGIPTPRDRSHLFSTASPDRFFYGITLSLHNFLIDYVYRPLRRVVPGKMGRFAAKFAIFAITALFFRTRPEMLLFASPVLIFALVTLFKKRWRLPLIPRTLLLSLSILSCSFYTLALMLPSPIDLFSMVHQAFENGALYDLKDLFEMVRDASYLAITILAFFLLVSVTNLDRWFTRKAGRKLYIATQVAFTVLLFAGFIATLFFFYPQFPQ